MTIQRSDGVITIPEEEFEDLCDWLQHDSWRCMYPDRYSDCCCGLDDLCDKLGIPRVERPNNERR